MRVLHYGYDAVSGENIGDRKVIYIDSNGKIKLAKANSLVSSNVCGFTAHSVTTDDKVEIIARGCLCGFTNLVPGDAYYLSQTSYGEITNIKPLSGIIIKVGVAIDTTKLDVHLEDISVILTSPNETKWIITVDNDGVLSTEEIE